MGVYEEGDLDKNLRRKFAATGARDSYMNFRLKLKAALRIFQRSN